MKKLRVNVAFALAFVVCVIVFLFLFGKSPSKDQLAKRLIGCLSNKDSECLADLEQSWSVSCMKLTKESAKSLFQNFFFSSYDRLDPNSGDIRSLIDRRLLVTVVLTTKEGRNLESTFEITDTESGPRVVSLGSTALLFYGNSHYYVPGTGIVNGIAKLEAWKRMISQDSVRFSKMGIEGVCTSAEDGLRTWDVLSNDLDVRIQRAYKALNESTK